MSSEEATSEGTDLEPERVAEMLREGAVELIDVRTDEEWEAGRVAGARHLELEQLPEEAGTIPRERPVVFQCRSGTRSGMAAEAFRQAGWDAYNMRDGLLAWVERGLPLEPEGGEVVAQRLG